MDALESFGDFAGDILEAANPLNWFRVSLFLAKKEKTTALQLYYFMNLIV